MTPQEISAAEAVEVAIFDRLPANVEPPGLFILGAPRTGSTFLYQALASAFGLPYVDNLTNRYFGRTPVVGLMLSDPLRRRERISFSSRYGKTDGLAQPSEGSALMTHWFGGGHPSQTVSRRILDGKESHLKATLAAVDFYLGGPLTIKNAWNCFRTDYLASALPRSAFVWIRRDMRAAAKSDLAARYAVQGDARAWNSATPSNVEELRTRPPTEQVVENQFEFGKAISSTFSALPENRCIEVWYEDLVANPRSVLAAIGGQLEPLRGRTPEFPPMLDARADAPSGLEASEAAAIDAYVEANMEKLRGYLRS